MMNKVYYYTYQEMLNLFPLIAPSSPHSTAISADWFTHILSQNNIQFAAIGLSVDISSSQISELVNCLMTQVYNRHASNYIISKEVGYFDDAPVLDTDDFKKAMFKIINIINLTLPRYIPLLIQFENASGNPLKANKSEGIVTSRFNDTPQNGGDYSSDDHTSNITQGTNSQELEIGTLMTRLSEVYQNFRSILADWSNEFNKLFLLESQI